MTNQIHPVRNDNVCSPHPRSPFPCMVSFAQFAAFVHLLMADARPLPTDLLSRQVLTPSYINPDSVPHTLLILENLLCHSLAQEVTGGTRARLHLVETWKVSVKNRLWCHVWNRLRFEIFSKIRLERAK